jgi:hypothetical protein
VPVREQQRQKVEYRTDKGATSPGGRQNARAKHRGWTMHQKEYTKSQLLVWSRELGVE